MSGALWWRYVAAACAVASAILSSFNEPKAYHVLGVAGVAALLSIAFDLARIAERKP